MVRWGGRETVREGVVEGRLCKRVSGKGGEAVYCTSKKVSGLETFLKIINDLKLEIR